jgi:hypothetical protein
MFQGEPGWCDQANEQVREARVSNNSRGNYASCCARARRRIERLRELQQLRDLLDDPELNDRDWTVGYSGISETADEKAAKNDK